MKTAYLIEMTIFRDYARQLIGLGALVSLCIGFGMQTPLAMPATLTCMFFMMAAMGLAAYDELNRWVSSASRCRCPAATWCSGGTRRS